jgi:hypothetical protein
MAFSMNRKEFQVIFAGTLSCFSAVVSAQLPVGTTFISESADTTTINDSVNCGGFSGSSFYRAFKLKNFPSLDLPRFRVQSVTFGVYRTVSTDGVGTPPMTINVYSTSAFPPKLASLTLLDSVTFSLPDSAAATYTFPLPHQPVMTVATDTLVVEVFYKDTANSTFFIGGNDAGQSAPTYERAPDCFGFEDITDLATLGPLFGRFSLLLLVNGDTENLTPVRLQSFDVE